MRPITQLFAITVLAGCSATPIAPSVGPSPTAPAPTQPARVGPAPTENPPPVNPPEGKPPKAKAGTPFARLMASQNRVASDLYARGIEGDDNFVMSPMSISLAFGMVYAGAQGNTQKEMAATFRYDVPQSEIHAAFSKALQGWNSSDKRPYELAVANRLFGEKSYDFKKPFLGITSQQYGAELERLDFRSAAEPSRLHINQWIADATNDHILDLLPKDSIQKDTALVLTNAVYFKGKWKQAFDKNSTAAADFTTPTKTVKAKMMHLRGRHRFAHVGGVKMLEMAYQGDKLAMQLVLPDHKQGLGALEGRLAAGALDELASGLGSREVIVAVPRFTIAPTKALDLTKVLKDMGMVDAWSRRSANLRGIANVPPNVNLFISTAVHKAFIEVQEEGTVAAAATAIGIVGATSVAPPPEHFEADHPFIFIIRDLETNAILFMGRVNDPTA